ncbi:hypothetical protein HBE96_17245 [Clostridium sp. P21]|uniref:Lipoprotein n=1 Tax=Clostridium muellerianum TaxID=2716538 RepID=A0A7Y0HR12_9CLOT|nr:hypothetical protein [Clostridium muellerianum]NMM64368.1 hypothetical protein [Clostridium muellerianum]
MKKILLVFMSFCVVFSLVACNNKTSNSSNSIQNKQESKQQEKNENKELKEFALKEDEIIKKEEEMFNNLNQIMNNKSKIDTYEKTNYNYSVMGEELHKLHEESKTKDFYNLAKLHIDSTTSYSYAMSKAVMYIALKGSKNWNELSGSGENDLKDALEKVKSSKDVYNTSKNRMLKEVIYEKSK